MPGVPGRGGPPPKRESQRRRTNSPKADKGVSKRGAVARCGDDLDGGHSDLGLRWWEALRISGQAEFYEASDWAQARLVVDAIDQFVEKPTAGMLSAIRSLSGDLLVTEGDRRRARLELEEPEVDDSEAKVARIRGYSERLTG